MKLDPNNTVFLTLDFQNGIFAMCQESQSAVAKAAQAVEFAREKGFHLIHVGIGFSEGHPEIPDTQPVFIRAKKNNLFVKGTPSAEFLPAIAKAGEQIVYKQRVSAFTENHLDLMLRSQGIEHLVLFGLTTSGIVLSTIRRASDLDYRCIVLEDACYDHDEEVHRVLTQKVFSKQGEVTTVDAFVAEQET